MTVKEFVKAFWQYAKEAEKKTGVSAFAILAQAALESGWGKYAPNNMFFGIKDSDGLNGNEQIIMTTEIAKSANLTPKEVGLLSIVSITPTEFNGKKYFEYKGNAFFRKYNTPAESFIDHMDFLHRNGRYKAALTVAADPYKFVDAIAAAGYASAPNYAKILKSIIKLIQNEVVSQKLS